MSGQPEPAELRVGRLVRKLGVIFRWSPLHLTGAELRPRRAMGDGEADAIEQHGDLSPGVDAVAELLRVAEGGGDGAARCRHFLLAAQTTPAWVDWGAVRRGGELYVRHAPAAVSLPRGALRHAAADTALAGDGAVLHVAGGRLLGTAHHAGAAVHGLPARAGDGDDAAAA